MTQSAPEIVATKFCSRCEQTKSRADFGRNKAKRDGMQVYCKPCTVAVALASRAKNPRRYLEYQADYSRKNRAAYSQHGRNFRAKNPEYSRNWDRQNPGHASARTRRWQLKNPDVVRAANAAYRAATAAQSIPLTPEQKAEIVAIYAEARRLTEQTGVPHHVDHIVPLNGRTVKGLHVPWNLRAIPAAENVAKGNSMPEAA